MTQATDFGTEPIERLLKLQEELGEIARRLASEGQSISPENPAGFFLSQAEAPPWHMQGERYLIRNTRRPLPDPRMVRRIIHQRRLRARYFDGDLFADPAWDILLDLTIARAEHTRVSVTSLCIAAEVPATTALRWIGQMIDRGLLVRTEDDADKRRAFIALSDRGAALMAKYFSEISSNLTVI